jgi:xanthosine utilization system XapX-like protein
MNNLHMFVIITSTIVIALSAPISSYAQQQMNFVATLSGKDVVPPVNTPATGVARFHLNTDGSLCYSVDVSHITGVLGIHIGFKNATELVELINPYATVVYPTGVVGPAYPTASVNGTLTSGDIKAGVFGPKGVSPIGLVGPLIGKNVTDLDKIVMSKNAYVTVRTVDHQRGEIQGQVLPSKSTVNCVTTLRFAPPSTLPSPRSITY